MDTSITSKSFLVFLCFIVCGKNTLHEIYPLNNFLSGQLCSVNCRPYAVQQLTKTYSPCITEILYSLSSFPFCPQPQPVATTNLFSAFIHLTILDSLYKIDAVFVLLWLISSLSTMFSRSIHVVTNDRSSFFLRLSNIPLNVYSTFPLFIVCYWKFVFFPHLGYCV